MLMHEHTLHRWGPDSHTHVKGLTFLGICLLSCATLCSSMWCKGWLGEVCLLHVCLPSMEFMEELRDQTAADGVCLEAMLALLYPVGQYNSPFLSHQVSNSCHPAARCLSKCVCRARGGKGAGRSDSDSQRQRTREKLSLEWGLWISE